MSVIRVGMPCHHPAWPLRCDRCGELASGFIMAQDREAHDGDWTTFGLVGMACATCHRIVIRQPAETTEWVALDLIADAVRDCDWNAGLDLVWLNHDAFDRQCRTEHER